MQRGELYDSISPEALTRATVFRDSETGIPMIRHHQNVVPILEQNKRDANAFEGGKNNPMGLRHVARIPNVVVVQLMQLGLLDYRGKIADERALLLFLSDPQNRHLRVDNGRRLA
jgi:hypothetical protein